MTSRKGKTIIGLFVLGAIGIVCAIMIVLGTVSFHKNASSFVLFFDSSLRGLTVGSSVYYNGVHVGKVTSMEITRLTDTSSYQTPVIIELDKPRSARAEDDPALATAMAMGSQIDKLIQEGLRAKLSTSSFITGLLVIDLLMDEKAAPVNTNSLKPYRGIPQIPTVPSGIDSLLSEFSALPIKSIADETLETLTSINKNLNDMKIVEVSQEIKTLLGHINTNVDELLKGISDIMKKSETMIKQADTTLKSINSTAISANTLLQDNSATMQELSLTMAAIRDAATSVVHIAKILEKKPNALIFGRGD